MGKLEASSPLTPPSPSEVSAICKRELFLVAGPSFPPEPLPSFRPAFALHQRATLESKRSAALRRRASDCAYRPCDRFRLPVQGPSRSRFLLDNIPTIPNNWKSLC